MNDYSEAKVFADTMADLHDNIIRNIGNYIFLNRSW